MISHMSFEFFKKSKYLLICRLIYHLNTFHMLEKWIETNDKSDCNDSTEQNNNQRNEENQSLFFGCFKYDPAIIGPRIIRPLTPFLNNIQANEG